MPTDTHGSPAAPGTHFQSCPLSCVQIVLYLLWGHLLIAVSIWVAAVWPMEEGAVLASIGAVIFTGLVANLIVVQVREGASTLYFLTLKLVAIRPPLQLSYVDIPHTFFHILPPHCAVCAAGPPVAGHPV